MNSHDHTFKHAKEHLVFFHFLRKNPSLRPLCFEQWVLLSGSEWEFCSHSCQLIIQLTAFQTCNVVLAQVKSLGYHVLSYDLQTWQEFPQIIADDIVVFSHQKMNYRRSSHAIAAER